MFRKKALRAATAPFRGTKALASMVFRRWNWRFWAIPSAQLNYQREVGNGTSSSTVMAVVLWIARTFPEAPPAVWRILDDGHEEREAKHPLIRLLARPNQFYSGTTLWEATLSDWVTNGDAYWVKIRDRGGRPVELWYVPSFLMEPKGDEKTFITHYEYLVDGEQIPLDPSDVVHFRYGLDPNNPLRGLSPIGSLLREVYTDDEAAKFTATLLRNMGVPGLVVSPAKGAPPPNKEQVDRTKAYAREAFGGDRRGEPLVMSGATEVHQFGFTPEQMDLKSVRRIPEERVSAVLGVPAVVVGLGAGLDRSTFTNFAEAREAAYESNMIPAQRALGDSLRLQLLPDFLDAEQDMLDYRVGFDLREVRALQEDRNKLVQRLNMGVNGGWVKVAEARRALELETDKNDEIYLRQSSVIETTGEPRPVPPLLPPTPRNGNGAQPTPAQEPEGATA